MRNVGRYAELAVLGNQRHQNLPKRPWMCYPMYQCRTSMLPTVIWIKRLTKLWRRWFTKTASGARLPVFLIVSANAFSRFPSRQPVIALHNFWSIRFQGEVPQSLLGFRARTKWGPPRPASLQLVEVCKPPTWLICTIFYITTAGNQNSRSEHEREIWFPMRSYVKQFGNKEERV